MKQRLNYVNGIYEIVSRSLPLLLPLLFPSTYRAKMSPGISHETALTHSDGNGKSEIKPSRHSNILMHVRMRCELRSWLDTWDIPDVLQYLCLDLCWIEEKIFRYQSVCFMVRKFHWKLTMNGNLRNLNFPPIYYTMVSNLLLSYYFVLPLYSIYYFILTITIRWTLCNNFGNFFKNIYLLYTCSLL